MPRRSHFRASAASLAAIVLGLAACGSETPARGSAGETTTTLRIGASFYPIEELVRSIGGDAVDVITFVAPGGEPHDFEPTPKQITALESADAVFYLGRGFQSDLEKAIDSLRSDVRRVDLLTTVELLASSGEEHEATEDEGHDEEHGKEEELGFDPHVWVDPTNMASMAAAVVATLSELDPAEAAGFAARGAAYEASMTSLAADFAQGLDDCTSRAIVTSHRAFAYLAERYDLLQISIAGVSPSDEPSAQTLESVAEAARDNGVKTVFFEENLPSDLSRTVADEIGAGVGVLDPVESLTNDEIANGDTYATVMQRNLVALRGALTCP